MAEFVPFHGLRYNTEKVNLSDVICPPYDVIKGKARDEYLKRDAHNIVGVELAARYGEDATPQQYAQSAALLKKWRDDGVLVRDDTAYYVYEQEFQVPGTGETKKRRGVIGALALEEFGKGVQPHEHTLSGPKQDRLNLLRALRTNTSPIFGLFGDDEGWVASVIDGIVVETPLMEAESGDGVKERVWRVTDDESVNAIEAAFEDEVILIADGHHRYETALNYRNEKQREAEAAGKVWTGAELENYVMMMCVSTSDAGLIVLPTHRLVKTSHVNWSKVFDALEENFEVINVATESNAATQAKELYAALNAADPQPRIGMHIKGQSYVLRLQPGDEHLKGMDSERSEAYNALDVSLLHTLILQNQFGIGPAELAAYSHVAYTIDAEEAISKVNHGEYGAAFILRSTPVHQVREVAGAGDKMPQKSTYFYPKLVTGLVLRPLD
jgi:uncharacterized protein (DUF1015 family)